MTTDIFQPWANHILISVPSRFVEHHAVGTSRLILPNGDDSWKELADALKHGENCHIEEDPNAHRTPVSTGQVLAIPRQLTADMVLCSGLGEMTVPKYEVARNKEGKPHKYLDNYGNEQTAVRNVGDQTVSRPKTAADIADPVQVGDEVHFESHYLKDDETAAQLEVMPGVYMLPYTALIAVVEKRGLPEGYLREGEKIVEVQGQKGPWSIDYGRVQMEHEFRKALSTGQPNPYSQADEVVTVRPIGGYVLLSRVWADDVITQADPEAESGFSNYRKNAVGLITDINVPPLDNEGIVRWVGVPLKGVGPAEEIKAGQRWIIQGGQALHETIAGEQLLVIRREYLLAERPPTIGYSPLTEEAYDSTVKQDFMADEWATKQHA